MSFSQIQSDILYLVYIIYYLRMDYQNICAIYAKIQLRHLYAKHDYLYRDSFS